MPLITTDARARALARAAESMLRALGGGEVAVRCPVAPAGSSANAELGMDGPVTQDFTVWPVVVRACVARVSDPRQRFELLFAPSTLTAYLADRGQDAQAFFEAALGIVHGEKLLYIESMTTDMLAGTPYLYRVIASE
jgi:hypothetical protein